MLALLHVCASLRAQPKFDTDTFTEQISMHFDKDAYLPGETVFFKSYLIQSGLATAATSNLFVEISSPSMPVIQKAFPVYGGSATGSFDLPASLTACFVTVRAFTENHLPDSVAVYEHSLPLVGNGQQLQVGASGSVSLRLFPEGGALTEGVNNTVAFLAIGADGRPLTVNAVLENDKGQTITTLETLHAGMGRFQFVPEAATSYRIRYTTTAGNSSIPLPVAAAQNLSLHVEQLNGKLYYIISTRAKGAEFDELQIALQVRGQELYRTKINFKDQFLTNGMIDASRLAAGIAVMQLFDKNGRLLASRPVFLNYAKATKPVVINASGMTGLRAKKAVQLEMNDTAYTNLSVAVYDATFHDTVFASSVASQSLVEDELQDPVFAPAYYFSDPDAKKAEHLDLLLLTHRLKGMSQLQKLPDDSSHFLTIKGTVKPIGKNTTMPRQLVLMIRERDGSNTVRQVSVNKSGRFYSTGHQFSDSATVYVTAGNGQSSANFDVEINGGLQRKLSFNFLPRLTSTCAPFSSKAAEDPVMKEFISRNASRPERTLEEVVVRTTKLSRQDELEQRYTSGFFHGGVNTVSVDVASDSLAWGKLDLYNYLVQQFPNAYIKYGPTGKQLGFYRYGDPLVFLNESLIDNEQLASINVRDVAYAKFIRQYFGTRNEQGTFSPAVVVYLRKGEDAKQVLATEKGLPRRVLRGYSDIKELPAPDHTRPAASVTDARTTLLWEPYVFIGSGNRKVELPFVTNDVSRKLKVIVQGVDEEGRFVYKELLIE